MIYGIGTDLVEISRMDPLRLKDHVLKRLFHPDELASLPPQEHRVKEYLAARFAAKEAFSKALGTGFTTFGPSDICTTRNKSGKPVMVLSEKVQKLLPQGEVRIHVSLSHEREVASAMVVIEVV